MLQKLFKSVSVIDNFLSKSFIDFNIMQASLATVDVIPLFLESAPDIIIDDKDIVVSFSLPDKEDLCGAGPCVHIRHIPTGFTVRSTGNLNILRPMIRILTMAKVIVDAAIYRS